ncbi:MAG TPA: hypothetical protein VN772_01460 [Solirubrobacteraceae bacterium]|nr:hypothetical protein [Solirubrobacteraceae bacterium]
MTTSSLPLALVSRRPSAAARGVAVAAGALALAVTAALALFLPALRTPAAPAPRPATLLEHGLLGLPLAAQGPVSAALGADAPAYLVRGVAGGLLASNAAQRLSARFEDAGVSVSSGATHLHLRLRAIGYGSSLRALGEVVPRAVANRVRYARSGLEEWYVNGPLGLEQGFTIARPPGATAGGPLTLAMDLSGGLRASLAGGAASVTFSTAGTPQLRYDGLSASDAGGRSLRSWLGLSGGRLLLHVDSAGARYPLRIDPFIHQGEKLTASGLTGPYGYVGQSVALSADGNTALVGAPADGEYTGAAFVFTRSGASWTQQAKLTGSGTVGESWFGESVALSADGNTALIGGPSDNAQAGAAWVFTRSGSTWSQQGEKLTGKGESGNAFLGRGVALSADGNTALLGGYNDNEHRGAAWVFTRSGSAWSQEGEKLTGGGNPGFFGWSVALSAEANTALIGEWGLSDGTGAAWVFTRSGTTWSKQGEALTAGGADGLSWFGYSAALSADGATALIGAPHGDGYAGQGFVFARSGSIWSQQGEPLTGREEIGEGELGYSAALSADGRTALLGGRVDEGFHGAAWAFQRFGSTWAQQGAKLTGSTEGSNREEFGWSAALSSGGSTAIVGSPCDKACVGSASAFLNAPELGRCAKVAKGTGAYGSSACITLGGTGDYAWTPGSAASGFTIRIASGVATIETVKAAKVTCAGETATGSYAGDRQVTGVVVTLTGCQHSGEGCSSSGAGAGEVRSNALEGVLGLEKLGTTTTKDKIGLDLFPVGRTGPLMEFSCATTTVSLRGSVIAPVKTNRMALSSPLKFAATKGKQKPEGFAGEPKDVLEASFGGMAFEQAGLTLATTQAGEEQLEINATI